jgi:MFS family permease
MGATTIFGFWRPAGASAPLVFAIALLAWTLTNMDQSLFGYALPGILAEFGRGPATAGMILSVSFLVASVMVVFAGIAADRFGRGPTLALLLGGSAVLVGLQGLSTGIAMLTVLRALAFGLSGGLSPVLNAMVIETVPARRRGMAMGVLQCGYPLGWLVASLLAAPLLSVYGWRAACFAAVGVVPVAVVIGAAVRQVRPESPESPVAAIPEHHDSAGSLRALLGPGHRRNFCASFATFFLFGGAYAGSAFFFPTFFTTVRGYSPSDAALLVGLSNGVAVIGYLAAAAFGEYVLTRRNVFALWCIFGAVALLGLLWLPQGRTGDFVWFAVMAAFFYGAMAVLPVLIAEIFPTHLRATALGAGASAPLSLGFALFPLFVPAVVADLGWVVALSLIITPALVLAALSALLLPSSQSGIAPLV